MYFQFLTEDKSTEILVEQIMGKLIFVLPRGTRPGSCR